MTRKKKKDKAKEHSIAFPTAPALPRLQPLCARATQDGKAGERGKGKGREGYGRRVGDGGRR